MDMPDAMTSTVATVEANAASGAMAAPTFIQPRAISSRDPPRMMPVLRSPIASPMRVQATMGRWNWRSSHTDAMPAISATSTTMMKLIVLIR